MRVGWKILAVLVTANWVASVATADWLSLVDDAVGAAAVVGYAWRVRLGFREAWVWLFWIRCVALGVGLLFLALVLSPILEFVRQLPELAYPVIALNLAIQLATMWGHWRYAFRDPRTWSAVG